MEITEALRVVIPNHLETVVRMLGIKDEELIHQANHLFTYGEIKEWLKPVILFLQNEYGIRLHLRSHENLSHPAELEALSLVACNNDKDEVFRLELSVKGVCFICPGLFLSQNDETATRFESYSMACHIVNRKVPATLFYQVLSEMGEPEGIRAAKVWQEALDVVQELIAELSPEKKAFNENCKAYYRFLNDAFGGYSKVSDRTEFGIKIVRYPGGDQRNVISMLAYRDEMFSMEVREQGLFVEFPFAVFGTAQNSFSSSKMARTLAASDDPTMFRQKLQRVLRTLHVLTRAYPRAEKTRRDILLTMNVGVRRMEVVGDSSNN